MKRHLLFLPDLFLVTLIIFSCERVDLSELRNSKSHFDMPGNIVQFLPPEPEIKEEINSEMDDWKDYLADCKEKAKDILSQIRHKMVQD